MRIQLVSKPTSRRTGIGRYAAELERGLRAAGVELQVTPLRTPIPQFAARLAQHGGYDLQTFFQSYPLRAGTQRGWITHITSQTLGMLLLTQRLPRPVVVTVHDILPYLLRHNAELSVYRNSAQRLMDALAMRGLRRADWLIADSDYTRRTLVDALGIPPGRISVVYLGIDQARFRPMPVPASFRQRYALPEVGPYLLYVGSEEPRKNISTLLRAFAQVRRGFSDATLLKVGAAGSIEYRNQSRRLAEELGIATAVRWFDEVPEADLPLFYNAAYVLVFPSRHEGFGFPVLEALACGTPVVAFHASSIPELAGDAATLVDEPGPEPFAGALHAVLAGLRPDPAPLITQSARFSWSTAIAATMQIHRSLCSREEAVAWTSAS